MPGTHDNIGNIIKFDGQNGVVFLYLMRDVGNSIDGPILELITYDNSSLFVVVGINDVNNYFILKPLNNSRSNKNIDKQLVYEYSKFNGNFTIID